MDCYSLKGQRTALIMVMDDIGYLYTHILTASIRKAAHILFIHTHAPVFNMPSTLRLTHVSLLPGYFICATYSYQVPVPGGRTESKKDKPPV